MVTKLIALFYGLICYTAGMASLAYTALWLVDLVPNALDAPRSGPIGIAIAIDLLILIAFSIQHSGMARPRFKKQWTRIVPTTVERSTYVLASALAMAMIFVFWQPIGGDIWRFEPGTTAATISFVGYAVGWALLVFATFCIDHFDLFGLRQVWLNLRGIPYQEHAFMVRGLYRWIRHPIYLGWFMVIWITPVMTVSHLLFALGSTVYILAAVRFEERDLMRAIPQYARYRQVVPMVIPDIGRHTTVAASKPV